jgi:hypothetical protein
MTQKSGSPVCRFLGKPTPADMMLVPGPKLRRMIGVSGVTLWGWRHDPKLGFLTATLINGRNFFPWNEVSAWLDRQPRAA